MEPKIGLALGAGGARGLAHIGVLKAFEENQIPVHYIAGSSIGAFVGALYANNNDIKMIEKLAVHLKRKHWLDLTVPKLGFVTGDKIKELIRILTHGKNIEELAIPLAIVATDIEEGKRVILKEGSIAEAVRASVSIPGIFVPERINGRLLVDGGVVERVPIHTVRELGAELVIAVDVGRSEAKMEVKTIIDVMSQAIDILEREVYHRQILASDYLIKPDVSHKGTIDFTNLQEIIDEGYKIASASIGEIKELINNWEGPLIEGAST